MLELGWIKRRHLKIHGPSSEISNIYYIDDHHLDSETGWMNIK